LSLEQSQTPFDIVPVEIDTDVASLGLGTVVITDVVRVFTGVFIGVFTHVETVEGVVTLVVDGDGALHPDIRSKKITEKIKIKCTFIN